MTNKQEEFRDQKRIAKEMAQQYLGMPVNPNWNDRLEYWNLRKRTMIPRGFMYVFDLKTDRCVLGHGMSFMGYEDNALLTASELLGAVHKNHRELFEFQAYRVHQALFTFTFEQLGFDYYSCGFHAVNDAKGKPWLTYYTSEVFQYDGNNLPCRYLSWCHVLSPYQGEPLYVDIFHRTNTPDKAVMKQVKRELHKIQEDQLEVIGFKEEQLEVLKMLSLGNSVKQVATNLGLSVAAINKRNLAALQVAKEAFPVSKFNYYTDLVKFLVKQGLI